MPIAKAPAKKAPGAKKAPASKRAQAADAGVRVSKGRAPGGYTVYGSALKTKHRTAAEIAAAVAALD